MTRRSRCVLELGRGVLQCNVEYAFNKSTAIPPGSESASDELKTLFLLCFIFTPSSYFTVNGGNTFKDFVCQLNCWSSLTQAEHNLAIFALDNIRNRQSPSWQKGLHLATPNVHRKHFHEAKSPPLYMFLICGPSLTSLGILIIHEMYAKPDLVWDLLHELTCSPLGGRGKDSIESIWIYQMQKLWIWRTSLNRVKLSLYWKGAKFHLVSLSQIFLPWVEGGRRQHNVHIILSRVSFYCSLATFGRLINSNGRTKPTISGCPANGHSVFGNHRDIGAVRCSSTLHKVKPVHTG